MPKTPLNHTACPSPIPTHARLHEFAPQNTETQGMGFKLWETKASVRSHQHGEGVSPEPRNQRPYRRRSR